MLLFPWIATADAQTPAPSANDTVPKVYMFKEITPENLVKIYEALGREAGGKVAVKLSTGEPGGNNFLQPSLIADLVKKVNGTIVECNTAYGGGRSNTEAHRKAAEHCRAVPFQRTCDGRLRRRAQEHLHRYRVGKRQALDSFRRKEHYELGKPVAGGVVRDDG